MKNVLVINAGSSSLKYQLIDMQTQNVVSKGIVERIGMEGSILTQKIGDEKAVIKQRMDDHLTAIKAVLAALVNPVHGGIKDLSGIVAIGHRVVHGGEKFSGSVLINDEVLQVLKDNVELAPLHNPANIMGIEACKQIMPGIPNVGVFDTAFHQTMPAHAYLYGIPFEAYKTHKIRRYGFHGTSHKYVSNRAAEILGKNINDLKIITCHLGNGSSVAAVDRGQSIDTSMGFTPLEGLVMGTRSGDIDPAIITYLMEKTHKTAEEVLSYLNKKSGVDGLSGVSSDFRDLWDAADAGNERATVALNVFIYRLKKYIGAYAAAMGGVDIIAFAGGIGENDHGVREGAVEGLEFLGVKINKEENMFRSMEKIFSTPDSKVVVMAVPTDEEMMIAKDTYDLINGKKKPAKQEKEEKPADQQ